MANYNLDILINAKNQATAVLKNLQKEIKNIGPVSVQASKQVDKSTNAMQSGFDGVKGAVLGVISAIGIFETTKGILKLTNDLEQNQVAFTTMLGSAEEANLLLKQLTDFASTTPFELTGIRQTAKQLLAFGIEAEDLIPTLKSLGDVSAGLSVPIEQVAYAYGQVKVAGRLMGQELMQFTNAGVPLIEELANVMGVAQSEVKDMVSEGKVGFADVEQAFKNMSGEGGKFFDLMDKQSGTLGGKWSNLIDLLASTGEQVGMSINENLKAILDDVIAFIETNLDQIVSFGQSLFQNLVSIGKSVFEIIQNIFTQATEIIALFTQTNTEETEGTANTWKKAFTIIALGIQSVMILINTAVGTVSGLIKGIIGGAKGLFQSASLYIQDFWSNVINSVIKIVNSFTDKINWVLEKVGLDTIQTFDLIDTEYEKMGGGIAIISENIAESTAGTFEKMKQGNMAIVNNMLETYENYGKETEKTNDNIATSFNSVKKQLEDLTKNTTDSAGATKEAQEMLKELQKSAEDNIKPLVDKFKDNKKEIEATRKAISKLTDDFKDFKSQGEKAILEVNRQLLDLKNNSADIKLKINTDETNDLASRYVQVKESITDLNKEIKDLEKQGISASRALGYGKETLEAIGEGDLGGTSVEDLLKALELNEQLAKYKNEQLLIEGKVSEETLKQAQNYADMSEAEKIIEEAKQKRAEEEKRFAEEKAKLEERKALLELQANQKSVNDLKIKIEEKDGLLQAYYEDEKGKITEIKNYENILEAQRIANKQTAIQQETLMLAEQYEIQKQNQVTMLDTLRAVWGDYNEYLKEETQSAVKNMLLEYQKLATSLQRIIDLKARAGVGGGGGEVSGARANGGPVVGGRTYLVGEEGPELWTAPNSGMITPNKDLTNGGQTININVTGNTIGSQADEQRLAETIKESLVRELTLAKNFGIS